MNLTTKPLVRLLAITLVISAVIFIALNSQTANAAPQKDVYVHANTGGTITYEPKGTGTGTVAEGTTANFKVPPATTITFTAQPAEGYTFSGWSGAGQTGNTNPLTINVNGGIGSTSSPLTANFAEQTTSPTSTPTSTPSFTPKQGTAIVDGQITEWDLTNDVSIDMYRAGKSDFTVQSKAYLRYDVATGTVYILVLAEPGSPGLKQNDEAWVKIDGRKVVDGTYSTFEWVNPGFDGDPNHVQGFEASFLLPQGKFNIDIHLNVFDDGESQTSRTLKTGIKIFVLPEYALGGLAAISACFAAYIIIKKRNNLHLHKHK